MTAQKKTDKEQEAVIIETKKIDRKKTLVNSEKDSVSNVSEIEVNDTNFFKEEKKEYHKTADITRRASTAGMSNSMDKENKFNVNLLCECINKTAPYIRKSKDNHKGIEWENFQMPFLQHVTKVKITPDFGYLVVA